eukprot:COSAG04_NODE_7842_length_1059_cov_2.505208_1_plen_81_part_00
MLARAGALHQEEVPGRGREVVWLRNLFEEIVQDRAPDLNRFYPMLEQRSRLRSEVEQRPGPEPEPESGPESGITVGAGPR